MVCCKKMLVIVDYGAGNLRSVYNAFKYLGQDVIISNKKEDLEKADYIILPGVGSFAEGMKNLRKLNLIEVLNKEVIQKKKPFLGICLGIQLIAKDGTEDGFNQGLGWIDANVRKLDTKLRLPHIGWNDVKFQKDSSFLRNVPEGTSFYFVHSYSINCNDKNDILMISDYGKEFVAAIQKGNIIATQFHPEKSHKYGLQLLKNFLEIKNAKE